jgi:hypothetical protein
MPSDMIGAVETNGVASAVSQHTSAAATSSAASDSHSAPPVTRRAVLINRDWFHQEVRQNATATMFRKGC